MQTLGSADMTIFDSIGGAPSVSVAVDKFYGQVLATPNWHRISLE